MLLKSVEQLRLEGVVPQNDDTEQDKLIALSLKQATSSLSALLGTDFDRVTVTDYFMYENEDECNRNPLRIFLSQGFLTDTAPVIKFADAFDDLASATADIDSKVVDKEKGVITLMRSFYPSLYMSVNYTAGFSTSESTYGKVYGSIPYWLDALATRVTLEIYATMRNWPTKVVTVPELGHSLLTQIAVKARSSTGCVRIMTGAL